jgi:hypothetical protein
MEHAASLGRLNRHEAPLLSLRSELALNSLKKLVQPIHSADVIIANRGDDAIYHLLHCFRAELTHEFAWQITHNSLPLIRT